jgi:hypothetical protein
MSCAPAVGLPSLGCCGDIVGKHVKRYISYYEQDFYGTFTPTCRKFETFRRVHTFNPSNPRNVGDEWDWVRKSVRRNGEHLSYWVDHLTGNQAALAPPNDPWGSGGSATNITVLTKNETFLDFTFSSGGQSYREEWYLEDEYTEPEIQADMDTLVAAADFAKFDQDFPLAAHDDFQNWVTWASGALLQRGGADNNPLKRLENDFSVCCQALIGFCSNSSPFQSTVDASRLTRDVYGRSTNPDAFLPGVSLVRRYSTKARVKIPGPYSRRILNVATDCLAQTQQCQAQSCTDVLHSDTLFYDASTQPPGWGVFHQVNWPCNPAP